jgi:TRAP transporter 4TM/12TM fusion protein
MSVKSAPAAAWLSTLIVAYHFLMVGHVPSWLGFFIPGAVHGAISLTAACLVIFISRRAYTPAHGRAEGPWSLQPVPWYDWLFIAALVAGNGFVIFFYDEVELYGMYGFLDTKAIIFASLLCVALLEAVRRSTGIALPVIILVFVGITLFQPYLPGLLYGQGYPLDRILYSAYVGEAGIYGLPLGVASTIIIVFLVFGAVMQAIGAGQWIIDLAMALTGWSRGGPAKAAVLASAMFGSVSGSPSGNAATTGIFTIPMMKAIGYRPAFAGAVEAVASTGGQILPPVMGAIAFVMADWIGVPYVEVVKVAALPAILYFLIVFVSVHLQAHRDGVSALPRAELPGLWPTFRRGWHFLIPFSALFYFLIIKAYPPGLAGIYSVLVAVASSYLSPDRGNWITLAKVLRLCHDAVGRWVAIAAITAAVGIMIGALELSGVGLKLSSFLVSLSGGNLLLTLVLVGFASLIVGMGLDAIPAYITLATLMAPALIELGVPPIAAHLFVVYWGLASFFTPPMCIAVYVVISISQSRVWETGWEAVRLGIASFLIPFAFVFDHGLLMRGSLQEVVLAFSTAALGAVAVAGAVRGYALAPLGPAGRLAIGLAGLLLIAPGIALPSAGLGLAALVLAGQYWLRERGRLRPAEPS